MLDLNGGCDLDGRHKDELVTTMSTADLSSSGRWIRSSGSRVLDCERGCELDDGLADGMPRLLKGAKGPIEAEHCLLCIAKILDSISSTDERKMSLATFALDEVTFRCDPQMILDPKSKKVSGGFSVGNGDGNMIYRTFCRLMRGKFPAASPPVMFDGKKDVVFLPTHYRRIFQPELRNATHVIAATDKDRVYIKTMKCLMATSDDNATIRQQSKNKLHTKSQARKEKITKRKIKQLPHRRRSGAASRRWKPYHKELSGLVPLPPMQVLANLRLLQRKQDISLETVGLEQQVEKPSNAD
ncbi:hypothetical protein IEQ34_017164 [Dendrobium chrysotoxum]|uniref:Uncharacterized protein n=1 Tax=Dendrobium chrysotoxum TaxID=161865 RepID=A0AAV7GAQ6_DENCH|nr:hypothetical protein IEQ34_017164 [Dendrobium chrysotoxum]